ncbi:MAG: HNH endonuclease signature motif containing protein [Bacteroidales bacterium]|nr:HNH endonuclease signature motif containing protein [Bacteroidales bacterium]
MSHTHDSIIVNGELVINIYNNHEEEKSDEKSNDKDVASIRRSNGVSSAKKKVKARDGACQCCGEVPVNNHLEVHHLLPIAKYKELASDEGNMISLCQKCHKRYHDMYDLENTNAVTFAKYLKDYGNRRY